MKPGPGMSACENRPVKWLTLCLGLLLCEKLGPVTAREKHGVLFVLICFCFFFFNEEHLSSPLAQ